MHRYVNAIKPLLLFTPLSSRSFPQLTPNSPANTRIDVSRAFGLSWRRRSFLPLVKDSTAEKPR